MLVYGIQPVCLQQTNIKRKESSPVCFRGDSFQFRHKLVDGDLSQADTDGIINAVNKTKETDSGYSALVYRYGDYIIKRQKQDNVDKIHLGSQNAKEYYALKEVGKISSDITPKVRGLIEYQGAHLLVEDCVQGTHPYKNHLTDGHVHDLLDKMAMMDEGGIHHCDLQNGNIFLINDKETKIIDFGSFHFVNDEGIYVSSDRTKSNVFLDESELNRVAGKPLRERIKQGILGNMNYDLKNMTDNPNSKMFSNVSNFEYRTLYPHLIDGSEENPLEFFRGYLVEKGKTYHTRMKDFYESYLPKDYEMREKSGVLTEEEAVIRKAMRYEQVASLVLSNPDDNVVKTELLKMQLKAFSSGSEQLGSSIPNRQKQHNAFVLLKDHLKQSMQNCIGIQREYFEENLKRAEYHSYVVNTEGAVDVPKDENIVNCLFNGETHPILKCNDKLKPPKPSGKKGLIYAAIGIGIGLLTYELSKLDIFKLKRN